MHSLQFNFHNNSPDADKEMKMLKVLWQYSSKVSHGKKSTKSVFITQD